LISFIVPAHNEERLLGGTLGAIHAAASPLPHPYEVIVVDDASTDGTAAVAAAHRARVVPVRFRQISRTRNAGARTASGTWLIFVDADTVVTPEAVRAAVDAMSRGAVGGGATIDFDGRLPLWSRMFLPVLRGAMAAGRCAAGCFIFCTRPAFEASAGFDEALYASEEIWLSRKLARQGRFVILRERVMTSGRKLRSHSGWDVLRFTGHVLRRGTKVLRSREQLSIWYGERQHDSEEQPL
jgi:glycosyltransferase involved in cell wall biosynthesis